MVDVLLKDKFGLEVNVVDVFVVELLRILPVLGGIGDVFG